MGLVVVVSVVVSVIMVEYVLSVEWLIICVDWILFGKVVVVVVLYDAWMPMDEKNEGKRLFASCRVSCWTEWEAAIYLNQLVVVVATMVFALVFER